MDIHTTMESGQWGTPPPPPDFLPKKIIFYSLKMRRKMEAATTKTKKHTEELQGCTTRTPKWHTQVTTTTSDTCGNTRAEIYMYTYMYVSAHQRVFLAHFVFRDFCVALKRRDKAFLVGQHWRPVSKFVVCYALGRKHKMVNFLAP